MEPEAVVEAWFAAQPELDAQRLPGGGWLSVLAGERKRTVPVHIRVGDHGLLIESFFMRAPDENQAELYRYLLQRHGRSYVSRFSLSPDGDVLLLAVLPLDAVSVDELDRVLGQLLTLADEAFNRALQLGFASYIEREQQWRAKVGLARNPIT